MKDTNQKPPEDDSSELVKFKRLAMRVLSVQKDEVLSLREKPKITKKRTPKKGTKK